MSMSFGVLLHVVFGTIALLSGVISIAVQKGGKLHRRAGNTYVVTMLVMAISGLLLALKVPVWITVLAGAMTTYLVVSAWLTVRRPDDWQAWLERAVFLFGVAVLLLGAYLSWRAFNGVTDHLGDYVLPAGVYFLFTGIVALAVALDVRQAISGRPKGKHRLLRHLWRMFFPMYVATSSLFSGQQQVFPESLQGTIYLELPHTLVLILLVFWLAKVSLGDRIAKWKMQRSTASKAA